MNYFLFSFITFSGIVTYAFESTITLSIDEMKKNTAVIVGGNMNKDDMLNVAARVFQLQLRASKCDGVAVNPRQLIAAEENIFTISSKNCVIKNKKNEVCESGFSARNISANPHTPDDAIIGEDIYKICIKDTGNNSGRGSSSEQRAVQ